METDVPNKEPIIASSSSNSLGIGSTDDFPTQTTNPPAEGTFFNPAAYWEKLIKFGIIDFPDFNWNAYGASEPECPEDLLSTKTNGFYNLPNISSDFAPLQDQWAAPISLSDANTCFLTFTDPTLPMSQEVLVRGVPKPITTLSQTEREAKEERLRAIKAEMAILTAEIAASK